MREWAAATKGVTRPNLVCCTTAHPAFDKGGQFLGVAVRKVPCDPVTKMADVRAMRRAVDSNTICVVAVTFSIFPPSPPPNTSKRGVLTAPIENTCSSLNRTIARKSFTFGPLYRRRTFPVGVGVLMSSLSREEKEEEEEMKRGFWRVVALVLFIGRYTRLRSRDLLAASAESVSINL